MIKSKLKNVDTWESRLSQIGQLTESEENLLAFKFYAWKELIYEKKIGYFALLRNLRNIIMQAPDTIPLVLNC